MKSVWREPYITINIIFAVVLVSILTYFGIFSCTDAYPVGAFTSRPLSSTGLQRALSEWVRFRPQSAMQFNPYSLGIFVFFVVQLIARILFSIIYLIKPDARRGLILTDAIVSILLFLCAFLPMNIAMLFNN